MAPPVPREKGEVALIDIKPFPCPLIEDCFESFDTQIDLVYHKMQSEKHHYDDRCNLLFASVEELRAHLMEVTKSGAEDKVHHTCHHCHNDYHSDGGLARHIKFEHRTKQEINCKGCDGSYQSASFYIAHLEQGKCKNRKDPARAISKKDFRDHINQKNIVDKLLHQGDNQASSFPDDYDDCGGVALDLVTGNDAVLHETQAWGEPGNQDDWPTLQASAALSRASATVSKPNAEYHGKHTGSGPSALTAANLEKTGGIIATAKTETLVSYNSSEASVFSSCPPAVDIVDTSFETDDVDESFRAMKLKKHRGAAEASWNGNKTSGMNDLYVRFWDPNSSAWNGERFYNPVIDVYECPHPFCQYNHADTGVFRRHCFEDHVPSTYRCQSCLNEYKTLQSLVAHCESPNAKCRIQKSAEFATLMHRLTGGYLDASGRDSSGGIVFKASLPGSFHDNKGPGEVKKFW